MSRAVDVRPTVHLAGATRARTACGLRLYPGARRSVTAKPALVTCGRCQRLAAPPGNTTEADQPPVSPR